MLPFSQPMIASAPPITASTLLAAAHSTTPFVSIYETTGYTKLANPSALPAGNGRAVAFNLAGTLLAVGCATTPFIKVYNVTSITDPSTWTAVSGISALAGQVNDLAFSPDGTRLVIAHSSSPGFTILETSGWTVVTNPSTLPGTNGAGCAFNVTGTLMALLGGSGTRLIIYSTSDFNTNYTPGTQPTYTAGGGVTPLAFNPAGTVLICCTTGSPPVKGYNVSDWSNITISTYSGVSAGNSCAFSPDGTYLMVSYATGGVGFITYLAADYSKVADPATALSGALTTAAIDKSSTLQACGKTLGTPSGFVYAVPNGTQLGTITPAGGARAVTFN